MIRSGDTERQRREKFRTALAEDSDGYKNAGSAAHGTKASNASAIYEPLNGL